MLARNHFQKSLSRKSYKFAHFHEKWNDIYVACYETNDKFVVYTTEWIVDRTISSGDLLLPFGSSGLSSPNLDGGMRWISRRQRDQENR